MLADELAEAIVGLLGFEVAVVGLGIEQDFLDVDSSRGQGDLVGVAKQQAQFGCLSGGLSAHRVERPTRLTDVLEQLQLPLVGNFKTLDVALQLLRSLWILAAIERDLNQFPSRALCKIIRALGNFPKQMDRIEFIRQGESLDAIG